MKYSGDNHLKRLFASLQHRLAANLDAARMAVDHPGAKGEASEDNWLKLLREHLPHRYRCDRAFVIDSNGDCSHYIDIVIYDRHYTPLLYNNDGQMFIPAESVYAVLEVKQNLDKGHIEYAGEKAASVRRLHRSSAPIAHAGGAYPPREQFHILAGILTYQSSWQPPFGDSFVEALDSRPPLERLDLGCAVAHGAFETSYHLGGILDVTRHEGDLGLIYFFFRLLARLQSLGTVPAIDYEVYINKVIRSGGLKSDT